MGRPEFDDSDNGDATGGDGGQSDGEQTSVGYLYASEDPVAPVASDETDSLTHDTNVKEDEDGPS